MNKQEYNRLAALFLGLKTREFPPSIVRIDGDDDPWNLQIFNPYDDANDMLLLEEKLRMTTMSAVRKVENMWVSLMHIENENMMSGEGKTPHESRRACAEEYLKEWKK